MTKKREPIGEHWRLELPKRDLICCVATTLKEAADHVATHYKGCDDLKELINDGSNAICASKRSQGVVLLFTYGQLYTNLLCHEATHATVALTAWMGVEISMATDELAAYLTDLIYRLVLSWWQVRKLPVRLLPPAVESPAVTVV